MKLYSILLIKETSQLNLKLEIGQVIPGWDEGIMLLKKGR